MTSDQHNFERLFEALPSSFNFYHLGEVERLAQAEAHPDRQGLSDPFFDVTSCGISYQIEGDLNTTLVILMRKGLDISIYLELGNILASKIAHQLFEKHGLELTISPPHSLSDDQLENLLENRSSPIRQNYVHRYEDKTIYFETLFVPRPMEEFGNA